jgi:hypothetical protein
MDPIQISIAVIMVGVACAGVVWLYTSEASASIGRMMAMMERAGLDPRTATLDDPRTMTIRKEMRRRCRRCPREELCDRWLAGKVEGNNSFCPNAESFNLVREPAHAPVDTRPVGTASKRADTPN